MSAGQLLTVARSHLGVREDARGSNPFGRAYGVDRVAWCAQFTWACFQQASLGALTPKTAYTPTLFDWYRKRGLTGTTPRAGALVFFNWPGDGVDRVQHVGIVEAVNANGTITTIEGNTTSGAAGNQSDGGGVYRRIRATTAVVGYAYPAYPGGAPAPAVSAPASGVVTVLQGAVHVTQDGKWGPNTDGALERVRAAARSGQLGDVRALQKAVGTGVDGKWGPKSKAALEATVKRIQAAIGVTADGAWGPKTEAAFQAARAAHYRR